MLGFLMFTMDFLGKKGECTLCGETNTVDNIVWFTIDVFVPVDYTKAKRVTFFEIEEVVPMFSN